MSGDDIFTPLPHGEPRPFKVEFAKDDIDELQAKLGMIRWGPEGGLLPKGDPRTDAGLLPTTALLHTFVEAWKTFDFDAKAREMNRYEHFLVDIDWCTPLHYVHKRSSRADAMPIVLIHGWPGSFYEFWHTVDKLTEPESADDPAFHVVIPSLPGYAWSKGPPTMERGTGDTDGYCRILDTLMTDVLGYAKYASQGGDWGSTHARCLAAKYARPDGTGCRAVHLNFSPLVPKYVWALSTLPAWFTDPVMEYLPGQFGVGMRKLNGFHKSMAYYWVQQMRPSQLAPGLTDSPVGLLAWFGFFWGIHLDSSPTFSTEAMLSIATVYFVTRSIGTSFLPYHNNDFLTDMHGDKQYKVSRAAMAYSHFPHEIVASTPHSYLKSTGDLRFYSKATKGGHFAALEEPDIFVNHLRVAFAPPKGTVMQTTRKDAAALAKLDIVDAKITGSLWFDVTEAGRTSRL